MKAHDVLIAYPKSNEKGVALKAILKALNIKFEVAQKDTYNTTFVKKIQTSRAQAKAGKLTRVKKQDIHEFLGL